MSKLKMISTGSYGDWMLAVIKFKGDKVGVCPILEDGTVDTKNVIVVSKGNYPDNLFEGKHKVQLSEDQKSITGFRPYSGIHPAKFTHFSHKKDQPPAPKTNISRKTGQEYLTFSPLFEIVDGAYKGVKDIPYSLYYNFMPDANGILSLKGGGASTQKVNEFLDFTVGLFDPPPWPKGGNILPGLERLAQKREKVIGLVFKNGNVDTLVELESGGSNPPWKQKPDAE